MSLLRKLSNQRFDCTVKLSGLPITVDCNILKQVFKDFVAKEDRSINFMIFRLEEEKKESQPDKVTEMLSQLGEKPNIEVSR